jgi:MoxR-like ATPase
MEERQITIDGDTKELGRPFFVIATQNPIETQGTFPLPEAQLDRFFMRLRIGYPSIQEGRQLLDRFQNSSILSTLKSIAGSTDIADIQKSCPEVTVGEAVKDYIMDIIEFTRKHEKIALGVSPRGSLALMKATQAYAIIHKRSYVTPDDVKALAVPVLSHRIILKGNAISSGTHHAENVVAEILCKIPVPTEEF